MKKIAANRNYRLLKRATCDYDNQESPCGKAYLKELEESRDRGISAGIRWSWNHIENMEGLQGDCKQQVIEGLNTILRMHDPHPPGGNAGE